MMWFPYLGTLPGQGVEFRWLDQGPQITHHKSLRVLNYWEYTLGSRVQKFDKFGTIFDD